MSERNLSSDENCGTCKYWSGSDHDREHGYQLASCVRHAPIAKLIVTTSQYGSGVAEWPQTSQKTWCGDWEKQK